MDRDYFDTVMNDFGVFLKNINSTCNMPTDDEVKVRYFNNFKHLPNQRFYKLAEWLKDNWKWSSFGKFPAIPDFKTAMEATYKPPEIVYNHQTKEEKLTSSKLLKIISRDIKLMVALEKAIYHKKTGKIATDDTPRAKTLPIYQEFIHDMLRKNMVFDIKNQKWEPNKGQDRALYFIPRCYYPGKYY